MKRPFLAVMLLVLAVAGYADLHVLLGPSILIDRQNAINGTALGLNATLWGLVPKRPHLGVVGAIDPVLYVGSSDDAYDFSGGNNNFGINIAHGYGYAFLLSREIHLETFGVGKGESAIHLFSYGISERYDYSEDFDVAEAVDSFAVLPEARPADSEAAPEIRLQYVPLVRERRLHAGLDLNLSISPIYDVGDQERSGFFLGVGASLIYASYVKPDHYNVRVVDIADGAIVADRMESLWYSGGRSQIVKLSVFYDLFDLFGIDEPGYEYNYDNKFGVLLSVSLFGADVTRPREASPRVTGLHLR